MEIPSPARPGSLGKRWWSPKWLKHLGRVSLVFCIPKLPPKQDVFLWVHQVSSSNSASIRLQRGLKILHHTHVEKAQSGFNTSVFLSKWNSSTTTSRCYLACSTARWQIKWPKGYGPWMTPTLWYTFCTCVRPSCRPGMTWQKIPLPSVLGCEGKCRKE